jgi:hypothetical protein
MDDRGDYVIETLGRLDKAMYSLVGNGDTEHSQLGIIRRDVQELKVFREVEFQKFKEDVNKVINRWGGAMMGAVTLVSLLNWVLDHLLKR